ncbi:MAG: membrane integrity-associated transporter subunit PqiC [Acetobacteraceae bacterium]|nr:membrane integrity-associated transporter subunit PqiC [Acetobacteraceae bacterium]
MTVSGRIAGPAMLLLAALAACSSPNPNLYTIAPVPGSVEHATPKVVLVRDIVLARYLERTQIVRSSENYRLAVLSNDWWGEPLSAMLSRVLTAELSQRLPGATVYGNRSSIAVSPDATIDLNIDRLDEDASGKVVLQGQAGVTFSGRGAPLARPFRFVETPPTPGTGGEVAAISAAVGKLATQIAAMLVARPTAR